MKILWVKTDFLHPTTRGGQIRTLEMVRELHKHHEVHYVAFDDAENPEGLARSSEYCSFAHPIPHRLVSKRSPAFALQLTAGIFAPIPVSGMRYQSSAMRDYVARLEAEIHFDAKVCDFLFPSINLDGLSTWTLFQHNVESLIWERHAQSGRTPLHKAYFALQAKKMYNWEKKVCQSVGNTVAVSTVDEMLMRDRFGITNVTSVPTGVDTAYFEKPLNSISERDLVFVGSMDWMPNIDGMRWFLSDVFPRIQAQRPGTTLAIVGRNPPPIILEAASDPLIHVTGTVPDVRPYLWKSSLSIVPLRVGGGTRLKIFEAMAAGIPVVSTTIGAEGLPAKHGNTIQIADSGAAFADECLALLSQPAAHERLSQAALNLVVQNFSWEQVTRRFESALARRELPALSR